MQRDQIIAAKVHARTARPSINMATLARQMGISRQALRRRLDHGGWKYDELERLAQALDMTVDQLVSDETSTTINRNSYADSDIICPDCGAGLGEHYTHCIHHHG